MRRETPKTVPLEVVLLSWGTKFFRVFLPEVNKDKLEMSAPHCSHKGVMFFFRARDERRGENHI